MFPEHDFFKYKLGCFYTEHNRYAVVVQTGNNDFNVEICYLQSTGNSAQNYVKSAITCRLVINIFTQWTGINSHSVQ